MNNYQRELIKLFSNYGIVKRIDKKINLYIYTCIPSKLFAKKSIFNSLPEIKFLLLFKEMNCYLSCFRIGNKEIVGENALSIINNINSSLEYGKYVMDNDGDINWEFMFNYNNITIDDIKVYLTTFFESTLDFFMLVRHKEKTPMESNNE